MHSRHDRLIAWILVLIQFGFIAAIVLVPRDPAFDGGPIVDVVAWGLVIVAGVLGLWAFRHLGDGLTPVPLPNGSVDLITTGPYRWVRHPMYSAVIVGMAGIALRTRTPVAIGLALGLALFLWSKTQWEERHLREGFDGYTAYAASTPRFLPLRPHRGAGSPGPSARHDG